MTSDYQICKNCILSSNDDPNIIFDSEGICNLCHIYYEAEKKHVIKGEKGKQEAETILQKIKKEGRKKQYDCIIGLSGGVDSTYLAYYIKQKGMRPLAVHLDNGWNSELAVKNIENVVKKLDIDLYTYVIDWEEFKDLQLSYLKASVVDIEIPSDNAIIAILYKMAIKHNTKYILAGHNIVTEGFLPESWLHFKYDNMNMNAIHAKFGTKKLRTYPQLGYLKKTILESLGLIKWIPILNYIDFEKEIAKSTIINKLEWKDYGWKHYESIFTRFYQGYILPTKFNIDKRKSHLSTLICSGQISRDDALKEIKKPIYDKMLLEQDKEYVIKKLGLDSEEFERLMTLPIKQHTDYSSIINVYKRLQPYIKAYKKIKAKFF